MLAYNVTTPVVNIHWVHGPEDQGETRNSHEERAGLLVLVRHNMSAVDGELVDDNQVGSARHGVPSPLRATLDRKGSKEAGQNHDNVSDDSDEDVGTGQPSEQAKIQEKEWGRHAPVNIACPVDLAIDDSIIGEVLVVMVDLDLVLGYTSFDGHSIVRQGSEGRDEGRDDVEHAFLLRCFSIHESWNARERVLTTGTRKAMA